MPWYLASFPWLLYLVVAWVVTGLYVARCLLRLRDGLEVAALSLPLGLVTQMLAANALGHVLFLPFALWWTAFLGLVGGCIGLARSGTTLAWDLSPRRRGTLL